MKKITFLAMTLLFGATAFAQLPEGFEGTTFPPTGWAVYAGANGEGTVQSWQPSTTASTGTGAAYVSYENVATMAEDWLVTPPVSITAAASTLMFQQRQQLTSEYGTVYTVRVSTTSQTDRSTFTVVNTQSEADMGVTYSQKAVNLSAYVGQTVYIAFVMTQDDGDSWYIDDVSLADLSNVVAPVCITAPTNPANGATNIPVGDVVFSWPAPATGTAPISYDLFYGLTPGQANILIGNYTTLTAAITLSGYSTTFYWKIVPKNIAGQPTGCLEWSFTTAAEPAVTPDYLNDFTVFPGTNWSLAGGTIATGPTDESNEYIYDNYFGNSLSGSESVAINIYPGFSIFGLPATNDWLLSPLFTLASGTHYINFDVALTEYGDETPATFGPDDFVALMYTTNNGATWTELRRWDAANPVVAGATPEIAFTTNGTVRFAFTGQTTENTTSDVEFFIDNFRVTQNTLSAAQFDIAGFNFYPNPVKDVLNISHKENVSGIQIFNLLGQNVLDKKLNGTEVQVDLSSLPTGNYMAKVQLDNVVKTIKILKQ